MACLASSLGPQSIHKAIFIFSLSVALVSGCAKNEAVARINGKKISLEQFDQQLRILKILRPDTIVNDATRTEVLDQMVKQQILTQEAKNSGLDLDTATQAAMRKQREDVRQDLLESIKDAKAQLAALDQAVEEKILVDRLLNARKDSVEVSEDEIKKAYIDYQREMAPRAATPLSQVRDQLRQRVMLEKLFEAAKPHNQIELYPEIAAQGQLD
jgi:hypothetical protein